MDKPDFLRIMLNRDYMYPSCALWRAIELVLLSHLDELNAREILDLGCGDGYITRFLFADKKIYNLCGTDVTNKYIEKAKKSNVHPSVYTSFNLIVKDSPLPFGSSTFDLVFSNCVLEHIPGVEKTLAEVFRILKPGGNFIFTVPSPEFGRWSLFYRFFEKNRLVSIAQWYRNQLNGRLEHYNLYDFKHWNILLRQFGLEVVYYRHYIKFPTAILCDLLEFIYTPGLGKLRLNAILIRLGIMLEKLNLNLPKKIIIKGYYKFLKKYFIRELNEQDNDSGAAILIVAKKPG